MSASMIWKGRLGVPYQGSKNQIAREIISILPRGKRFVDLFAGGCAMTHAAMISGKYDIFLANDLHGFGLRLFMDAIAGKCNGRWREWVSREEFMAKRDIDPLIALCWSFGNNQATYLFGREIENDKKEQTEIAVRIGYKEWRKNRPSKNKGKEYSQLQSLARLQSLERLQSLARLQALERSCFEFGSYDDFKYQDGDIVYCDIPYKSATEAYRFMTRSGMVFDYDRFYDWALSRDYPVFISEYEMPKGFTRIWEKNKKSIMNHFSNGSYGERTERVYVADRYADQFQTDLFLGLEDNHQ